MFQSGRKEQIGRTLLEVQNLTGLKNELERNGHSFDCESGLENEEEAAPVSEKRLKWEIWAEAKRRMEKIAYTEKDFLVVVKAWNKLD